jgi:anti-anti-sigma factor
MGQRPGGLRITVLDDLSGIAVAGDVDVVTMSEFCDAVAAAVERFAGDVHVDLSGLGFIDLEGLRTLVRASHALAEKGRKLVIISLPPHLREVLRIVGWSESLTVSGDSEDS